MLFLLTSFPNCFRGLVFCVLALLVRRIHAVLQFCTILFFFCFALCDFDGRFVLGEFTFRASVFRVACCYAPSRIPDRDAFFYRCIDSIDPSVPTLLCGDFNTVPDRFIDRRGSCPCLLYTSPSPRDLSTSRMPSSA